MSADPTETIRLLSRFAGAKPFTYQRLADIPSTNPQKRAQAPKVTGLRALSAGPARAGDALELRLAGYKEAFQSRCGSLRQLALSITQRSVAPLRCIESNQAVGRAA